MADLDNLFSYLGSLDPSLGKDIKRLRGELDDSVAEFNAINFRQWKETVLYALQTSPSQARQQVQAFTSSLSHFQTPDAGTSYLLDRLHYYEERVKAEPLAAKIDTILNQAVEKEAQLDGLLELKVEKEEITAYLLNLEIVWELKQIIASFPASTKPAGTPQPDPVSYSAVEKQEAKKKSKVLTRTQILKRQQGLPADQQLLTRTEVMIVLGGLSKSTFYDMQTKGEIPAPDRVAGKGRKASYLLKDVLKVLRPARDKRGGKR